MKKYIGAAVVIGASVATAGAAQAQSVSASVSMTTDYVFRGLSLSGEDPAIQGSFDYEAGNFYAGVWGSSLGSGGTSMELDVYAGVTPTIGPVNLDLGVIGYFYPGADDNTAEFDFYELALSGSIDLTQRVEIGAGVNFAPENYGETGQAIYYEINSAYAFSDAFAVSAAFGNYSIDDVNGPLAGTPDDDYNTWNVGGTYAIHGFELDLRYHQADVSAGDPIEVAGFATEAATEGRVVLTVGRKL